MKTINVLTKAALAFVVAVSLSSCAYRADLAQGNFVEQEKIDTLRYGMSYEQVQYIMGTPMLTDPFDASKWYYVHYLRQGWSDPQIQNLILVFANNRLIDIQGDFKKPADFESIRQDYNITTVLDNE